MKSLIIALICWMSIQLSFGQIKVITVKNLGDSTITIGFTKSYTESDPGTTIALGDSVPGGTEKQFEIKKDLRPGEGEYVHSAIYHANNDQIIVETRRLNKSDKRLLVNVPAKFTQEVNDPELQKVISIINESKKSFVDKQFRYIDLELSGDAAVREYLGAVVVVDTSDNNAVIKARYAPAQLDINSTPVYAGMNKSYDYRITKSFAGTFNASIPGAFTAQLNYETAELHHITTKIKKLGAIPFESTSSTAVELLLDVGNEEERINRIRTISRLLGDCSTCYLTQIQSVFAHKGAIVTTKSYSKRSFGFAGSSGSVVTTSGTYGYISGLDQSEFIDIQLLAIGLSEEEIGTSFKEKVSEEYENRRIQTKQIVDADLSNAQASKSRLDKIDEILCLVASKYCPVTDTSVASNSSQ